MLREYQTALKNEVFAAWNAGKRNVLAVAPTGAGKTRIKAALAREAAVPYAAIAHRQELVSQISMSLAREGLRHRIIAPRSIVQSIIKQQIAETRKNWYDPNAMVGVAGVDTLLRMEPDQWCKQVQIWDIDEAHHALPTNKWGKAIERFANAYGLGVTATPLRADKKPLGRATGGLFDHMAVGPSMRALIDQRFLSEYRIIVPRQSIDLSNVAVTDTGDYNLVRLREASHKSTITGDLVREYMRFGAGKLGITFVVDVETAQEVAQAYEQAGVPAQAVSAKTPDHIRSEYIRRFVNGEIRQLVNVDLFGEGMDVPAVEVVSMGRPTQSYGLYVQQFGRALRIADGKTHGLIIDHVGNVVRHNLPDIERSWDLNDAERSRRARKADDDFPLTVCDGCMAPYEAFRVRCPHCGLRREPAPGASRPEQVAGDLVELSPEALAAMRAAIARVDRPEAAIPHGASPIVARAITKRHGERQAAQRDLRMMIAGWAGIERARGLEDQEIYRKFWLAFGTDVATAQTLGATEAATLAERIRNCV